MEIGIRELKAKLSEILDRAERGEVIRVTDRGRPKAVIGPLPGRLRIEEGVTEGWITPPTSSARRLPGRRFRSSRTVAEILAEDRGE
jgi:prevent-host-death family protein